MDDRTVTKENQLAQLAQREAELPRVGSQTAATPFFQLQTKHEAELPRMDDRTATKENQLAQLAQREAELPRMGSQTAATPFFQLQTNPTTSN